MPVKKLLILFLLGLAAALLGSVFVASPGYMDADYYFAVGRQLAEHAGFNEPFIWNYLSDPLSITHPSNQYWMPLTSILSAGFMSILGNSFRAAQAPFLLLTAFLPVLTGGIAYWLHRSERLAFISGLLAIFPGFFLPYFLTTDMFVLFAILGTGVFWLSSIAVKSQKPRYWILAGILVGLGYLARADGILLLVPASAAILIGGKDRVSNFFRLLIGLGVVMMPWWIRNLIALGTITPPGSVRTLWITSYNELFTYPARTLTFQRWFDVGIVDLFGIRFEAASTNIKRLIAENGLVFLWPFILLGGYRFRSTILVRISAIYLLTIFLVMSIIFPFAGAYGGFFHSSSALMPVLWSLAPVGLGVAVKWGSAKRNWEIPRASRMFGAAMVLMAAAITIVVFTTRVIGGDFTSPSWNNAYETYEQVGLKMDSIATMNEPVAVNNPPGFYVATGRRAIVIPNGDEDTLKEVVTRYDIRWVILDSNQPEGLARLYENPQVAPWLELAAQGTDASGNPIWILRVNGNTDHEQ